MQGTVQSNTEQGGQGVILGDDGKQYTFTALGWRDHNTSAQPGMRVDYDARGSHAVGIYPLPGQSVPVAAPPAAPAAAPMGAPAAPPMAGQPPMAGPPAPPPMAGQPPMAGPPGPPMAGQPPMAGPPAPPVAGQPPMAGPPGPPAGFAQQAGGAMSQGVSRAGQFVSGHFNVSGGGAPPPQQPPGYGPGMPPPGSPAGVQVRATEKTSPLSAQGVFTGLLLMFGLSTVINFFIPILGSLIGGFCGGRQSGSFANAAVAAGIAAVLIGGTTFVAAQLMVAFIENLPIIGGIIKDSPLGELFTSGVVILALLNALPMLLMAFVGAAFAKKQTSIEVHHRYN